MMVRPVRTHASSVRSAAKKTRGSPIIEAMAWKRIIGFPDNTTQFLEVLMLRPVRIAALTALAAVAFASPLAALAQAYPTKPVTIIVPWPPGGPSDIAARPMAKGLRRRARSRRSSSTTAAAPAATSAPRWSTKAAPDGYTLLITSSAPIVINPSLYKQMPFDPPKDLAPSPTLRVPLILAVNPSVPAKQPARSCIAYVNVAKGQGAVRVLGQRHAAAPDGRALQVDREGRT